MASRFHLRAEARVDIELFDATVPKSTGQDIHKTMRDALQTCSDPKFDYL